MHMEGRIEELLNKYWEGGTDLAEEAELRTLLARTEAFPAEKRFFLGISELAAMDGGEVSLPRKRVWLMEHWKQIAASLSLVLVVGTAIYRSELRKAEEEAYLKVVEALTMIQENMQRGTAQLEVMQEMKHLNTTEEIFQISEKQAAR